MQNLSPSSQHSIILYVCFSYVIQFIPISLRTEYLRKSQEFLMKHILINDHAYIQILTRYIQTGGIKALPSPENLLQTILNSNSSGSCPKLIGTILSLYPSSVPIFWHWLSVIIVDPNDSKEFSEESCQLDTSLISFLGDLLLYVDLPSPIKGPNDKFVKGDLKNPIHPKIIERLIQYCWSLVSLDSPFHIEESALICLKYFVHVKLTSPVDKHFPSFRSSSLVAIVESIWAEYASYGDLKKIPSFSPIDSSLASGSLHILAKAIENPNFSYSSLYINHWLWDSILSEFEHFEVRPTFSFMTSPITTKSVIPPIEPYNSSTIIGTSESLSESDSGSTLRTISDSSGTDSINSHSLTAKHSNDSDSDFVPTLVTPSFTEANWTKQRRTRRQSFDIAPPADMPSHSILSLSIYELDSALKISHILPGWFFVHAMRARSKNIDVAKKMCQIIGQTPFPILKVHMHDFCQFCNYAISMLCSNELALTIRELIIPLKVYKDKSSFHRPFLEVLIHFILKDIDYFDENSLYGRLNVINEIFRFNPEIDVYLDIYDSIWESLSVIKLSLSLSRCIFTFFTVVVPNLDYSQKKQLLLIASAPLFAFSFQPGNETTIASYEKLIYEGQIQAEIIYKQSKSFSEVIHSDIISNPQYVPSDSFPLVSEGLILLKSISFNENTEDQKFYNEIGSAIFKILPQFLILCPIEACALGNHLLPLAISLKMKEDIINFGHYLGNTLSISPSPALIMLSGTFQMSVSSFISFDITHLMRSNLDAFPDDINFTRISLQTDSSLAPLLLGKLNQIDLLYETWAPKPTPEFIYSLSNAITNLNDNQLIRKGRTFLYYFSYLEEQNKNPIQIGLENDNEEKDYVYSEEEEKEFHRLNNWIKRTFMGKKPYIFKELILEPIPIITRINLASDASILKQFSKAYPIIFNYTPGDITMSGIILGLIKSYQKDDKCIDYLTLLVSHHVQDCLSIGKNHLWFLKFLTSHRINFKFPSNISNPKCIGWGYRLLKCNFVTDRNSDFSMECDWKLIELLHRDSSTRERVIENIGSNILELLYLPKGQMLSPYIVKELLDRNIPSITVTLFNKLVVPIMSKSDPGIISIIEILPYYFQQIDMSNPILFSSYLLISASLAGKSAFNYSSLYSPACRSFLQSFSSVFPYSASVFQSIPSLLSIVSATERSDKCRIIIKKLFSNPSFSDIHFDECPNFDQTISTLAHADVY